MLPAEFVEEAQDLCRETLKRGDGVPVEDRIAAALRGFASLGITADRLEAKIGKPRGQWGPQQVADLGQQAGSRGGDQQMSSPSRQYRGQ